MSIAAGNYSSGRFRGGSGLSASWARPTQDGGPMRERAQNVGGNLVSSIGIVQERDAQVQAQSDRSRSGQMTSCAECMPCDVEQRLPQGLPHRLGSLLTVQRRRWLAEASATLCVLGGFTTAPLLTLLAWLGLMLPAGAPLHGAATTLLVIAIIWLSLALVSAHMHCNRQHPLTR